MKVQQNFVGVFGITYSLPGHVVGKVVEIQALLQFHLQAGFQSIQFRKGEDSPMVERH